MSVSGAKTSKSAIDRAGVAVSKGSFKDEQDRLKQESLVDAFREEHLAPLTAITLQLQDSLAKFDGGYYIAQRLKRKPQIIRKLKRLSVRLTQLQDIGGCRIVVKTNGDVDRLHGLLKRELVSRQTITIAHEVDYRRKGREDSGYRALHIILERGGRRVELQLRSEAQHYWAEQIERTSIIYGYYLKEQEGHASVIRYFHVLSDIFYEPVLFTTPSVLT